MSHSQKEERRKVSEKKIAENTFKRRQGAGNPPELPKAFHARTPPAFLQPLRGQPVLSEHSKGLTLSGSSQAHSRPDLSTLSSAYDFPHSGMPMNPHMLSASSLFLPPGVDPAGSMMVPQHLNSFYVGHPGFYAPPLRPPMNGSAQQVTSALNNYDYDAATAQYGEQMSSQQQKILSLLENGFIGSVEELIETAGR